MPEIEDREDVRYAVSKLLDRRIASEGVLFVQCCGDIENRQAASKETLSRAEMLDPPV